jgi:hypothetical protein
MWYGPAGSLATEMPSIAMGRPKAELLLSADEQAHVQSIARSRSLLAALVRRTRATLIYLRTGSLRAVQLLDI